MRHFVVIGGGFGDEGKGQMVDYLAASFPDHTVVRFNGGPQAGHTVVTPDGERHVFSQIGSGSFVGNPSHFSRFTYSNLGNLRRELAIFKPKSPAHAKLSLDPRVPVVTLWDRLANQAIETARGKQRHGSVGHGILQTRRRHEAGCSITIRDVVEAETDALVEKFRRARDANIKAFPEDTFKSEFKNALDYFLLDVGWFRNSGIRVVDDADVVSRPCIFEGAQGLLLDEDAPFFPHVTPSKTGLHNVVQLCQGQDAVLDTVYMTRTYLTRHGRGPMYAPGYFGTEWSARPADIHEDITNCPNPWQEHLRYGDLNVSQLLDAIDKDDIAARRLAAELGGVDIHAPRVAVTWANARPIPNGLESHLYAVAKGPTREHFSIVS